jgi:phosphoglycolate phosphatase
MPEFPSSPLLIFDLDGTLVDTIQDIASSVNRTLVQFNFDPYDLDAFKKMVGNGFWKLIEFSIPMQHRDDKVLVQRVHDIAVQEYASHCLDTTVPFPRMLETLNLLSARGYRIAVLSNKPDNLTHLIVQKLFKGISFLAVWGDLPNRPRKPDPSAALQLCRMADIKPEHAAFIGDSGIDMETAKFSRMRSIGALYGYRSREELAEAGAECFIESPGDLLSIFP